MLMNIPTQMLNLKGLRYLGVPPFCTKHGGCWGYVGHAGRRLSAEKRYGCGSIALANTLQVVTAGIVRGRTTN